MLFKWKRRKDNYTVTDKDGTFLFNYNILIEEGPPPKRMKHLEVLKEIELKLRTDFEEKVEPMPDEEGDITI